MSATFVPVKHGQPHTERHLLQKSIWEQEHAHPSMFPFLDSALPSPGVVQFWDWMKPVGVSSSLQGLDVCCGKGRNTMWLAAQGASMVGFDFSQTAIDIARQRKSHYSLPAQSDFLVHDAYGTWPFPDHTFDFVVDCFGSSDIESGQGRRHLMDEAYRVLKPGGYYHLQIDSPELGYFAQRIKQAPGDESGTLLFPNGKVEAVLTEDELENWNYPLKLVEVRRLVESTLEICGQTEPYKYFWIVARSVAG
jgi:SAM-dependent methyltransferase